FWNKPFDPRGDPFMLAPSFAGPNSIFESRHSTFRCLADRTEATAEITDWVLQGMRCRRVLDGIVRIKYKNNPGKRAAWISAAHVEEAPKKKDNGGPPPPTP